MADYPAHLVRLRRLKDGRTVTIRPVRAEDGPREGAFLGALSEETRHRRFQRWAGPITDGLVRFFTHVDYDRHMAFVCEAPDGRVVGDARYVAHDGGRSAEFGIVVADDWHHTGIAQLLMEALLRAARARGFETLEGLVLADNRDMLDFVRELGFEVAEEPRDPATVRVVRKL